MAAALDHGRRDEVTKSCRLIARHAHGKVTPGDSGELRHCRTFVEQLPETLFVVKHMHLFDRPATGGRPAGLTLHSAAKQLRVCVCVLERMGSLNRVAKPESILVQPTDTS